MNFFLGHPADKIIQIRFPTPVSKVNCIMQFVNQKDEGKKKLLNYISSLEIPQADLLFKLPASSCA